MHGPWTHTTMWEIPALAIINELRSRAALRGLGRFTLDVLYARAKAKLWSKVERLRELPDLRISDFGTRRRHSFLWHRWCVAALKEGLGDTASRIVADIAFDVSDNSIDHQVEILKDSGAEILVFNGSPAPAARAIRRAAELDWHPVFLLNNASASIASALRPAGLQNAVGVISTAFLKDAGDSMWKEDQAIKEWSAFMDKYYPDGDKDDGYALYGYAAAVRFLS